MLCVIMCAPVIVHVYCFETMFPGMHGSEPALVVHVDDGQKLPVHGHDVDYLDFRTSRAAFRSEEHCFECVPRWTAMILCLCFGGAGMWLFRP